MWLPSHNRSLSPKLVLKSWENASPPTHQPPTQGRETRWFCQSSQSLGRPLDHAGDQMKHPKLIKWEHQMIWFHRAATSISTTYSMWGLSTTKSSPIWTSWFFSTLVKPPSFPSDHFKFGSDLEFYRDVKLLYKQFARFDSNQLIGVSEDSISFIHLSFCLTMLVSDNVRDSFNKSWNRLETIPYHRWLERHKIHFYNTKQETSKRPNCLALSLTCFSNHPIYM